MGALSYGIVGSVAIANRDGITQSRPVFTFEKPREQHNFGSLLLHNDVFQPAVVTVKVPARLHLGFLDLNGGLGRRFGGIGLAISGLGTSLTIQRTKFSNVSGPEAGRVGPHLQKMERLLALGDGHEVKVSQVVPAHAGLGSGTQLALAVAAGLRRLHNLPLDVESDALRLGRGARSGVGIGLFSRGGLVVDGGRGDGPNTAPIISHLPFPDHWRVLVILDPQRQGVHGPEEGTTIATLPPMSEADAAHLCRLILMKALPALANHDLLNFGAAIKELQIRLGDHFAPVQGGLRFMSRDVAAVLDALDNAGAFGVGQSSWGPTGFAFAPTPDEAARFATIARQHPNSRGLDIRVCEGLNRGAEIVAHAHAGECRQ
jgi:beta-ribofuranosylaminobenzene 5'-phosphate synthase